MKALLIRDNCRDIRDIKIVISHSLAMRALRMLA
jgi:hypothetical protein